ncbi:MAG: hypothetical protein J6J16_08200 [Lachnospiraceae bacterium]|nr:hypothetical protein [Lachnospiraceae bacterium]
MKDELYRIMGNANELSDMIKALAIVTDRLEKDISCGSEEIELGVLLFMLGKNLELVYSGVKDIGSSLDKLILDYK